MNSKSSEYEMFKKFSVLNGEYRTVYYDGTSGVNPEYFTQYGLPIVGFISGVVEFESNVAWLECSENRNLMFYMNEIIDIV